MKRRFRNKSLLNEGTDMSKNLLVDYFEMKIMPGDLVESSDGKRPYLKGRLGLVETATANGRIYPKSVMGREIERLKEDMASKKVYGTLGHPRDGKTDLYDASHYVVDAEINENNEIIGTIEFIPGLRKGDAALAIARSGGTLGVSSRGFGTTLPDVRGRHRVQEDYKLATWDIVADPANAGAYPAFVVESSGEIMDLEMLKKEHPELVEEIRKEIDVESREHARVALKEDFEKQLKEEGTRIQEEAVILAKKDLLNDPEVAGAKTVVESIKGMLAPYIIEEDGNKVVLSLKDKISRLEKRIKELDEGNTLLQQESNETSDIAKELGYHLYLERTLGGDRAKHMVGLLGDVKSFDTFDSFKGAVNEIMESIDEDEKQRVILENEITKREKRIKNLEEQLDSALKIGNKLGVRAYLEKRINNHPRAIPLRKYVMEANPSDKNGVDKLIESYDVKHPVSSEYKKIRKGLSNKNEVPFGVPNRVTPSHLDEITDVLGVPMRELKNLI